MSTICVFHSARRKEERKFIGVRKTIITKICEVRRQFTSAECEKVSSHYFTFTADLTAQTVCAKLSHLILITTEYLILLFFCLINEKTEVHRS